tara:strand:+ start:152 stop:610 length:459 start_codon:yes stop_codon:yes gene_type:complete
MKIILIMGLPGAGKTTLANELTPLLKAKRVNADEVRKIANDWDFSIEGRNRQAHAKIQIGMNLTKGLGAGAKHNIGQAAADESIGEIVNYIQGSNMVFIAAGMGGGTGTGASHVIAKAAKELNILTVGVTTLPFDYEGSKRMRRAVEGLEAF